ncbi:ABC transporter substrate-binding protein [Psychromonas sp. KJ10-10]|uniref:ABC transporter substrate-binding protein n=1 Tax=Psychromonas sp. KJ10-10 TaxID=3391823 RepID=UPI0039B59446
MRFLFICASLSFLTGCYQTESTITDSLLYCADKAPTSFNPQVSHDTASLDATTHQLYNNLIRIDPVSRRFVADIAKGWQSNQDKTEYTFYLNEQVTFHQTDYFQASRHLNADDVIFSLKRLLSTENPFHDINSESENYFFNHPLTNIIKDIIKIDDHTVRIILTKSDATLLANLAAHYSVILSLEYADELLQAGHPEKIDFFPIGTGPYQFKNYQNNIIRFQKHKNPWQSPAHIDNLIFDITANSTKRYAKLLSGECDVIANPAPSQVDQISQNPNVSLSIRPTGNVALIAFNSKSSPFNDVINRHALSNAIDLNTVIQAVFFNNAVSTDNLLPAHSWAFNPRTLKHQFSPEQSLKKLQENDFNFEQTLRILAPIKKSIYNPNFYKTAELIQANWANIGVKSEIVLLRQTELDSALASGDYDIFLTGKSPNINDPDNIFRPLLSCKVNQIEGNTSRWCDPDTQALLDSTLVKSSFIQRVKNYYQLQELVQSQRIYLPIAHLLRFDVYNKNITNIQVDTLTGISLHQVNKVAPLKMLELK